MNASDVLDIELELTGYCNLKCPLCASVLFRDKCGGKNIRPIDEWINQLNSYTSLKSVCISGICSEPTLYPWLFQLLDYLVRRNISIELYTNGCTNNIEWWNNLNKHLTERDLVVFTICGSTQELHEKYRVGSSLQQILDNVNAFKQNNKHNNDCVQHIKFQYNALDFEQNMKHIIDIFHNHMLIDTSPLAERYGIIRDGIYMPNNGGRKYEVLVSDILQRRNANIHNICCKSKYNKFLTLDQFGNEYPCMLYRLFSNSRFDKTDYTKIESFVYEFCYDCDKRFEYLSKKFHIEGMI